VQQYLTIWDLVLTPIYLIVLVYFGRIIRNKNYKVGNPLRKYFLPGLYAKFGGAIFISLIYQYYYGGGDTYNYYEQATILNSSLDKSVITWFQLILNISPDTAPKVFEYSSKLIWYNSPSEHLVVVVTALLGLLNFSTFLPIALLFAAISYTGIWVLYRTFFSLYPKLHKQLAIAILFIPSTLVWGSSIFKDTICMFGVGWMTYTTFRIFINRDLSIKNFFFLGFSFYTITTVKVYIILAFIPALSLWLMMSYTKNIRNTGLRWISNLFFIFIMGLGLYLSSLQFSKELNRYSLDRITETLESTKGWITYASGDEGSTYKIVGNDGSITGMILNFPSGVIVTLFRPFIWEVRKLIVALSAIESLIFLYLTIKIFLSRSRNIKLIFKDPTVLFCLVFALIFAYSVGISSGNFGALSRYKIPCLPFFGVFLVISLYNKDVRLLGKNIYSNKERKVPLTA
jgi:hypothetical protein